MAAHMHVSTAWTLAGLLAAVCATYVLGYGIYNLYLHPLRAYPGPFLHRAGRLAYLYRLHRGTLARNVLQLHEKYGPVVRITADELSFVEPEAWKDIYGHKTGASKAAGLGDFPKPELFYRQAGIPPSIISESNENHAILRRQLAHGFSERSMREQEPMIGGYVDMLIKRLREHCAEYCDDPAEKHNSSAKVKSRALDIKDWYTFTTFDITGDLTFGESFGMLDESHYHPWVKTISEALRVSALMLAFKQYGSETLLTPVLKWVQKARSQHMNNTEDKLQRRMALDPGRPDLMEGLLRERSEWSIDFPHLASNASTLIIAGSETTASLLSGATYLLLTNPDSLRKATEEIRSSFATEKEITLGSVGRLEYLLACLQEALRRYPPVPIGLPRNTPKGGAVVAGHVVPGDMSVACWGYAQSHSSANWTDPFAFKPERFIDGHKNEHDKLDAMQPFSMGPRNCIGRNLAHASMRLILAKLLYNFDISLAEPNKNWMDQNMYIVWQKPPLMVHLTPVQ